MCFNSTWCAITPSPISKILFDYLSLSLHAFCGNAAKLLCGCCLRSKHLGLSFSSSLFFSNISSLGLFCSVTSRAVISSSSLDLPQARPSSYWCHWYSSYLMFSNSSYCVAPSELSRWRASLSNWRLTAKMSLRSLHARCNRISNALLP